MSVKKLIPRGRITEPARNPVAEAEAALAALVLEKARLEQEIVTASQEGRAIDAVRARRRLDEMPLEISAAEMQVKATKAAAFEAQIPAAKAEAQRLVVECEAARLELEAAKQRYELAMGAVRGAEEHVRDLSRDARSLRGQIQPLSVPRGPVVRAAWLAK